MEIVSKKDIQVIHALLANLGLVSDKEYKRSQVEVYSNGRETSTAKLYAHEAAQFKADLQEAVNKRLSTAQVKANDKRRRIIAMAHEMLWELPDGCVDMERVNGWCVARGHMHKPLNDYTLTELSKLIWQFEQVRVSLLNGI